MSNISMREICGVPKNEADAIRETLRLMMREMGTQEPGGVKYRMSDWAERVISFDWGTKQRRDYAIAIMTVALENSVKAY